MQGVQEFLRFRPKNALLSKSPQEGLESHGDDDALYSTGIYCTLMIKRSHPLSPQQNRTTMMFIAYIDDVRLLVGCSWKVQGVMQSTTHTGTGKKTMSMMVMMKMLQYAKTMLYEHTMLGQ